MGHRWMKSVAINSCLNFCELGRQRIAQLPESAAGAAETHETAMPTPSPTPRSRPMRPLPPRCPFAGAPLRIAALALCAVLGLSGIAAHAESAGSLFKHGQN